ncbi:hypothetical protein [Nocardioides dongkuii]|uniref:hypothetical protein n=1 Tax=Nocardioides dongkuii TaxID=2760089 RepID=UPI0015FC9BD5|nr:hypothetical protein [Nocardioides dongkuii]
MSTARTTTLVQDLDALHASYVAAINSAVESDRDDEVAELAAAYDREATVMVAEREGRTHLLPLLRRRRRSA